MSEAFDNKSFERMLTVTDGFLGARYTPDATSFRVWAPTASKVELLLSGQPPLTMSQQPRGVWEAQVRGDLHGAGYLYRVRVGYETADVIDPYARALTRGGAQGMVLDLQTTHPEGWRLDTRPALHSPTDAVIYEVHLRDLTAHPSSGVTNAGKYLGLAETGSLSPAGDKTCLEHMLDLGVTHVQIMPVAAFSTDESSSARYHWGYEPLHFFVPEGSYACGPDGGARIRELKTLVATLHANGLRVILDVVVSHTGNGCRLNQLVPGYYYRMTESGHFSNGSGCGNELASQRVMTRRLIVDAIRYWAEEFHIDGFRFDLMGLLDLDTLRAIRAALDEIDPSIVMLGEGWTGGVSALPSERQGCKGNLALLDHRIAAFCDDFRDAVRGSIWNAAEQGFLYANTARVEDLKLSIAGGVPHPQVRDSYLILSPKPWCAQPSQCVPYLSCHDNHTLWDRLALSCPQETESDRVRRNKLAAVLLLTAQGLPLMLAGEDFARTKGGASNSFDSGDAVNLIDWNRKAEFADLTQYYRGLIQLRRTYDVFRLRTAREVQDKLSFADTYQEGVIVFTLPDFWVVCNASAAPYTLTLPQPADVLVNGDQAGLVALDTVQGSVEVAPVSAMVLRAARPQGKPPLRPPFFAAPVKKDAPPSSRKKLILGLSAVAAGTAMLIRLWRRRSK